MIARASLPFFRCQYMFKLPDGDVIDYAMSVDDFRFPPKCRRYRLFLEAKKRPYLTFGTRGGYYISNTKMMRAKQIMETNEIPCWMAIRFDDGIIRAANFYWGIGAPVVEAGRMDRPKDPKAIEPCVAFDWGHFKLVR